MLSANNVLILGLLRMYKAVQSRAERGESPDSNFHRGSPPAANRSEMFGNTEQSYQSDILQVLEHE